MAKFELWQYARYLVGLILILGGIILIPFPVLPGWIFVFLGAFLMGLLSKNQIKLLEKELFVIVEKSRELVTEESKFIRRRFIDMRIRAFLRWLMGCFLLLAGFIVMPLPFKFTFLEGMIMIILGSMILGFISWQKVRKLEKEVKTEVNRITKIIKA